MVNLILKTIQLIIIIVLIAIEIILIEYIIRFKSRKPTKSLKKIAIIKKHKINKKILYEIMPKEKQTSKNNILYFHGGAYSSGLGKVHWNFIERLIKDTQSKIFVPDYPLIPKNTYKDVFKMVNQIYKDYIKEEKFILIGDSAGGGISLAFSQKLGEENEKMPEKIILISPWLDITMKNRKINEVQEKDKRLNKTALKIAGELYCGKNNLDNYLVSPINGPTTKINNIYIFTGTHDILNPDIHIFKEKIEKKKLYIYEKTGAEHNWILDTYKNEEDYQKLLNTLQS